MLKKLFQKIKGKPLIELSVDSFLPKQSFSQHGEDLLILPYLNQIKNGKYLDIGAYHPEKWSNTKLLFDMGWAGINIDPNPLSIEKFNYLRPNDINLCIGISDEEAVMKYYMFEESALNTFSIDSVNDALDRYNVKPNSILEISVTTIDKAIHPIGLNNLDYLNIDAEGMDLKVLKSIDLKIYNPRVITIETGFSDISKVLTSEVCSYLSMYSYKLVAKTLLTSIFVLDYE